MNVIFPAKLSSEIYAKARKAFPNEEYAILLGKKLKNGDLSIQRFYFPTARLNDLSPDYVSVKTNWFETAAEIGLEHNLEVLGDIHSHCYDVPEEGSPGCDPSEADWEWAEAMRGITKGSYRICGIIRVLRRDGKISCKSRFWPAIDLPKTIK